MSKVEETDPSRVIDAIDLPIVVLDRDANVSHCNAAASRFLSIIPSDVGRTLRQASALDGVVANVEELCEHVIAGGSAIQRELRTKDGSWFVVRATPYLGADRQIAGALITFTNVTGLRASLEQSIYEREFTKTILNTVISPLVVVDAGLRIQTANRAFHATFQLSREETQGTVFCDLRGGDWNNPELRAGLERFASASGRQTAVPEFRMERLSVRGRTLNLDARSVSRDSRRGELILVSIEDVTERVQAENAIRRRTAQLELLINEAPLGVYLVDADLRLRALNPKARPAFAGVPDPIGHDFVELMKILRPTRHAEIVVRFRHTLETGQPYYVAETSVERRDGNGTDFYEWQINRIPLPDGRGGVVCYLRDISAQVEARQTLARSESALRMADRRKDEFLATLAHELRNPLAPIRTGLELVRRKLGSSPVDRHLDMMSRQTTNLERIVDDLLEVSRITRGKIDLRKIRLDLGAVVTGVVESARGIIEGRGHDVSVTLPVRSIFVEADPVRVEQILTNLLSNAVKYTEPGGRIWIAVARADRDVEIRVKDTGIGIPEELLPRVFELFEQGRRDLARSTGGLGIGLSIVKTLTELHGGTVVATSEGIGKGSEFIARFPIAPDITIEHARPQVAEVRAIERLRILVVDDNADAGELLVELLGGLGHDVRLASDGPTAIRVADDWQPNIIFLDIGLPEMDGYEVARRIRTQNVDIPLIALTGYGHEAARRQSKDAGFTQHLVKPPALEAILGVLERVATPTCRAEV
jgi:PAS domain S-box-containing protein